MSPWAVSPTNSSNGPANGWATAVGKRSGPDWKRFAEPEPRGEQHASLPQSARHGSSKTGANGRAPRSSPASTGSLPMRPSSCGRPSPSAQRSAPDFGPRSGTTSSPSSTTWAISTRRRCACSHQLVGRIAVREPTWLGDDEAQRIVTRAPHVGREQIAWVFWTSLDAVGEKAGSLWRDRIGHWLLTCWQLDDRRP